MAPAAKGKVRKTVRKRREKKNIERGAAHIRSSFNNTMVTQRPFLGILRRFGLPWQP